jgi:hypothetical protein
MTDYSPTDLPDAVGVPAVRGVSSFVVGAVRVVVLAGHVALEPLMPLTAFVFDVSAAAIRASADRKPRLIRSAGAIGGHCERFAR